MILAELSCGIALGLERSCNRRSLGWHSDVGAGLAHGCQARAQGNFPGDEGSSARRATGFGIIVGEQHALRGQLVEIGCLAGHHAPVIGADVEPADIVAHDEDDVWRPLPGSRRGCGWLLGLRCTNAAARR